MTFLTPTPQLPEVPPRDSSRPAKLAWVTVPLIVQMVLSALGIILLPFLNLIFSAIMNAPSSVPDASGSSPEDLKLGLALLSGSIWIIELFSVGFLVLCFLAFRAVQEGKSWGRIVAIIVFMLALFNFPLGTALGIFGLIGAFDTEVTAYCNR